MTQPSHSNAHPDSNALHSWSEEKQSVFLYRVLASVERDPRKAQLFESLAQAADEQSKIWELKMGSPLPVFVPSFRARVVASLLKFLGPRAILQVLAAMKVRGISVYSSGVSDHVMPTKAPLPGDNSESYHKKMSVGGNLRATVFGMNDGLVSNASLILGVAGAQGAMEASAQGADSQWVLTSGVAGLLAGAFSMAAGEYISVKSQREVFEYQIGLEKEELELYPDEEARELALIYEAKGIEKVDAQRISEQMVKDPKQALETLAREELGLNPSDLGSPWGAALYSFLSFAMGAIIPLLPYLILNAQSAFWASIALSLLALLVVGALISLFTGKSAVWGALRMAFVGSMAGLLTFGIGHLFGAQLS